MKQNFKLFIGIIFLTVIASLDSKVFASDIQNHKGVISQFYQNGKAWSNVDAKDLNNLLGDEISILTADNQSITLKLRQVIPGAIDHNRPDFLLRSQSLIAVFDTTAENKAWLAEAGSQTVDVFHYALGSGKFFVTPVQKKDGGYSIEVVLD